MTITIENNIITITINLEQGFITLSISISLLKQLWNELGRNIFNFTYEKIKNTNIYQQFISKIDYFKLLQKLMEVMK